MEDEKSPEVLITIEEAQKMLGLATARPVQALAQQGRIERVEPEGARARTHYTLSSVKAELERRKQRRDGLLPVAVGKPFMGLPPRQEPPKLEGERLDERIEEAQTHDARLEEARLMQQLDPPEWRWFPVGVAARIAGLPPGILHDAVRDGRLPAVTSGGMRYVKWCHVKGLEVPKDELKAPQKPVRSGPRTRVAGTGRGRGPGRRGR